MAWSVLTKFLGGSVGNLADGVAGAVDRFVETEEERKAAELLLIKIQQQPDKWQLEVNKIQAAHRSVFVAGPRPFIMWTCGVGIALNFIFFPIADWVITLMNVGISMPEIKNEQLMTLVLSLLGLGSLRTYEKRNGLTQ